MNSPLPPSIALAVVLQTLSALAGPALDSYWPLHNGDQKTFIYSKNKTLSLIVYEQGFGTFEMYEDSEDVSQSLIVQQNGMSASLTAVEVGWIRASLYPPVVLLNDSVLQNGGTTETITTVSQTGLEAYPATFTVTVKKAGTITVPAGIFTDCRSITAAEQATIPGHGKVNVKALTAYLAPGVGIIKMAVAPGQWALLQSGTINGTNIGSPSSNSFHTLTVEIMGNGKVTPNYDGKALQDGKTYTVTAKPSEDYVFAGWFDGDFRPLGTNPTLTFTMQEGLMLRASFTTSPFVTVAGKYNGLFADSTVKPEASGLVNLNLTKKGSYSGTLLFAGKRAPFSGQFDIAGLSRATSSVSSLVLDLQVDLLDGSDTIGGTVHGGTWTTAFGANRAVFDGRTKVAVQAGKYTVVFPGAGSAGAPVGDGFGTVSVNNAGTLLFAGTLADGSKVSQSVPISKDGGWPLYASLYKGKGLLHGWLGLSETVDGDVTWVKQAGGKYYPQGFGTGVAVAGSRYVPPSGTANPLNFTSAIVTLTGGGLAQSVTNPITLGSTGKLLKQPGQALTLVFVPSNGSFRGTFAQPGARPLSFNGVALQYWNFAAGFFLGATESGQVTIASPEGP